jgi:hypothetical protein
VLLQAEADIRPTNKDGRSPLHNALNGTEVEVLLRAGADKEARDHHGRTPLHIAAWADRSRAVKALIEAGADKQAKDKHGSTPLHLAAQEGKKSSALELLRAGADKEAKDKSGRTPLHVAAEAGHLSMADQLKRRGAVEPANYWQMTADAREKGLGEHKEAQVTAPAVGEAKIGSNWYFAEHKVRCLRQVVLVSEPRRRVASRYHQLWLGPRFIEFARHPLVAGLLKLHSDPKPVLLVRTDGIVEEVSESPLHIALSFFHLPTSGLVAFHVSCLPLRDRTRMGFLEQIYGLDSELTRGLVANALRGDGIDVVYAGGGGVTHSVISPGRESEEMEGPRCEYDIDIPFDSYCRATLAEEWNAVLAHHRSIQNPDFQAAGKALYRLMPEGASPILPR